ncbi:hypothetical protein PoB_007155600 [Plakobranchus ocellatus]|uniref:Uncharacterized protein n=1 Tax=Plakobranchus ocellatus TaxID=259542 RepID=A0AAV4DLK3_9GAST|nr:hypothetical protein PoB_007155600 [Plakobranchus ocellatus]
MSAPCPCRNFTSDQSQDICVNNKISSQDITAVQSTVIRSIQFSLNSKKGPKTKRFNIDKQAVKDLARLLLATSEADLGEKNEGASCSCKTKTACGNLPFDISEKLARASSGKNFYNLLMRHYYKDLSDLPTKHSTCSSSNTSCNSCETSHDSKENGVPGLAIESFEKINTPTIAKVNPCPLSEDIQNLSNAAPSVAFQNGVIENCDTEYPQTDLKNSASLHDYHAGNVAFQQISCPDTKGGRTKKKKKKKKCSSKSKACDFVFNARGIHLRARWPNDSEVCFSGGGIATDLAPTGCDARCKINDCDDRSEKSGNPFNLFGKYFGQANQKNQTSCCCAHMSGKTSSNTFKGKNQAWCPHTFYDPGSLACKKADRSNCSCETCLSCQKSSKICQTFFSSKCEETCLATSDTSPGGLCKNVVSSEDKCFNTDSACKTNKSLQACFIEDNQCMPQRGSNECAPSCVRKDTVCCKQETICQSSLPVCPPRKRKCLTQTPIDNPCDLDNEGCTTTCFTKSTELHCERSCEFEKPVTQMCVPSDPMDSDLPCEEEMDICRQSEQGNQYGKTFTGSKQNMEERTLSTMPCHEEKYTQKRQLTYCESQKSALVCQTPCLPRDSKQPANEHYYTHDKCFSDPQPSDGTHTYPSCWTKSERSTGQQDQMKTKNEEERPCFEIDELLNKNVISGQKLDNMQSADLRESSKAQTDCTCDDTITSQQNKYYSDHQKQNVSSKREGTDVCSKYKPYEMFKACSSYIKSNYRNEYSGCDGKKPNNIDHREDPCCSHSPTRPDRPCFEQTNENPTQGSEKIQERNNDDGFGNPCHGLFKTIEDNNSNESLQEQKRQKCPEPERNSQMDCKQGMVVNKCFKVSREIGNTGRPVPKIRYKRLREKEMWKRSGRNCANMGKNYLDKSALKACNVQDIDKSVDIITNNIAMSKEIDSNAIISNIAEMNTPNSTSNPNLSATRVTQVRENLISFDADHHLFLDGLKQGKKESEHGPCVSIRKYSDAKPLMSHSKDKVKRSSSLLYESDRELNRADNFLGERKPIDISGDTQQCPSSNLIRPAAELDHSLSSKIAGKVENEEDFSAVPLITASLPPLAVISNCQSAECLDKEMEHKKANAKFTCNLTAKIGKDGKGIPDSCKEISKHMSNKKTGLMKKSNFSHRRQSVSPKNTLEFGRQTKFLHPSECVPLSSNGMKSPPFETLSPVRKPLKWSGNKVLPPQKLQRKGTFVLRTVSQNKTIADTSKVLGSAPERYTRMSGAGFSQKMGHRARSPVWSVPVLPGAIQTQEESKLSHDRSPLDPVETSADLNLGKVRGMSRVSRLRSVFEPIKGGQEDRSCSFLRKKATFGNSDDQKISENKSIVLPPALKDGKENGTDLLIQNALNSSENLKEDTCGSMDAAETPAIVLNNSYFYQTKNMGCEKVITTIMNGSDSISRRVVNSLNLDPGPPLGESSIQTMCIDQNRAALAGHPFSLMIREVGLFPLGHDTSTSKQAAVPRACPEMCKTDPPELEKKPSKRRENYRTENIHSLNSDSNKIYAFTPCRDPPNVSSTSKGFATDSKDHNNLGYSQYKSRDKSKGKQNSQVFSPCRDPHRERCSLQSIKLEKSPAKKTSADGTQIQDMNHLANVHSQRKDKTPLGRDPSFEDLFVSAEELMKASSPEQKNPRRNDDSRQSHMSVSTEKTNKVKMKRQHPRSFPSKTLVPDNTISERNSQNFQSYQEHQYLNKQRLKFETPISPERRSPKPKPEMGGRCKRFSTPDKNEPTAKESISLTPCFHYSSEDMAKSIKPPISAAFHEPISTISKKSISEENIFDRKNPNVYLSRQQLNKGNRLSFAGYRYTVHSQRSEGNTQQKSPRGPQPNLKRRFEHPTSPKTPGIDSATSATNSRSFKSDLEHHNSAKGKLNFQTRRSNASRSSKRDSEMSQRCKRLSTRRINEATAQESTVLSPCFHYSSEDVEKATKMRCSRTFSKPKEPSPKSPRKRISGEDIFDQNNPYVYLSRRQYDKNCLSSSSHQYSVHSQRSVDDTQQMSRRGSKPPDSRCFRNRQSPKKLRVDNTTSVKNSRSSESDQDRQYQAKDKLNVETRRPNKSRSSERKSEIRSQCKKFSTSDVHEPTAKESTLLSPCFHYSSEDFPKAIKSPSEFRSNTYKEPMSKISKKSVSDENIFDWRNPNVYLSRRQPNKGNRSSSPAYQYSVHSQHSLDDTQQMCRGCLPQNRRCFKCPTSPKTPGVNNAAAVINSRSFGSDQEQQYSNKRKLTFEPQRSSASRSSKRDPEIARRRNRFSTARVNEATTKDFHFLSPCFHYSSEDIEKATKTRSYPRSAKSQEPSPKSPRKCISGENIFDKDNPHVYLSRRQYNRDCLSSPGHQYSVHSQSSVLLDPCFHYSCEDLEKATKTRCYPRSTKSQEPTPKSPRKCISGENIFDKDNPHVYLSRRQNNRDCLSSSSHQYSVHSQRSVDDIQQVSHRDYQPQNRRCFKNPTSAETTGGKSTTSLINSRSFESDQEQKYSDKRKMNFGTQKFSESRCSKRDSEIGRRCKRFPTPRPNEATTKDSDSLSPCFHHSSEDLEKATKTRCYPRSAKSQEPSPKSPRKCISGEDIFDKNNPHVYLSRHQYNRGCCLSSPGHQYSVHSQRTMPLDPYFHYSSEDITTGDKSPNPAIVQEPFKSISGEIISDRENPYLYLSRHQYNRGCLSSPGHQYSVHSQPCVDNTQPVSRHGFQPQDSQCVKKKASSKTATMNNTNSVINSYSFESDQQHQYSDKNEMNFESPRSAAKTSTLPRNSVSEEQMLDQRNKNFYISRRQPTRSNCLSSPGYQHSIHSNLCVDGALKVSRRDTQTKENLNFKKETSLINRGVDNRTSVMNSRSFESYQEHHCSDNDELNLENPRSPARGSTFCKTSISEENIFYKKNKNFYISRRQPSKGNCLSPSGYQYSVHSQCRVGTAQIHSRHGYQPQAGLCLKYQASPKTSGVDNSISEINPQSFECDQEDQSRGKGELHFRAPTSPLGRSSKRVSENSSRWKMSTPDLSKPDTKDSVFPRPCFRCSCQDLARATDSRNKPTSTEFKEPISTISRKSTSGEAIFDKKNKSVYLSRRQPKKGNCLSSSHNLYSVHSQRCEENSPKMYRHGSQAQDNWCFFRNEASPSSSSCCLATCKDFKRCRAENADTSTQSLHVGSEQHSNRCRQKESLSISKSSDTNKRTRRKQTSSEREQTVHRDHQSKERLQKHAKMDVSEQSYRQNRDSYQSRRKDNHTGSIPCKTSSRVDNQHSRKFQKNKSDGSPKSARSCHSAASASLSPSNTDLDCTWSGTCLQPPSPCMFCCTSEARRQNKSDCLTRHDYEQDNSMGSTSLSPFSASISDTDDEVDDFNSVLCTCSSQTKSSQSFHCENEYKSLNQSKSSNKCPLTCCCSQCIDLYVKNESGRCVNNDKKKLLSVDAQKRELRKAKTEADKLCIDIRDFREILDLYSLGREHSEGPKGNKIEDHKTLSKNLTKAHVLAAKKEDLEDEPKIISEKSIPTRDTSHRNDESCRRCFLKNICCCSDCSKRERCFRSSHDCPCKFQGCKPKISVPRYPHCSFSSCACCEKKRKTVKQGSKRRCACCEIPSRQESKTEQTTSASSGELLCFRTACQCARNCDRRSPESEEERFHKIMKLCSGILSEYVNTYKFIQKGADKTKIQRQEEERRTSRGKSRKKRRKKRYHSDGQSSRSRSSGSISGHSSHSGRVISKRPKLLESDEAVSKLDKISIKRRKRRQKSERLSSTSTESFQISSGKKSKKQHTSRNRRKSSRSFKPQSTRGSKSGTSSTSFASLSSCSDAYTTSSENISPLGSTRKKKSKRHFQKSENKEAKILKHRKKVNKRKMANALSTQTKRLLKLEQNIDHDIMDRICSARGQKTQRSPSTSYSSPISGMNVWQNLHYLNSRCQSSYENCYKESRSKKNRNFDPPCNFCSEYSRHAFRYPEHLFEQNSRNWKHFTLGNHPKPKYDNYLKLDKHALRVSSLCQHGPVLPPHCNKRMYLRPRPDSEIGKYSNFDSCCKCRFSPKKEILTPTTKSLDKSRSPQPRSLNGVSNSEHFSPIEQNQWKSKVYLPCRNDNLVTDVKYNESLCVERRPCALRYSHASICRPEKGCSTLSPRLPRCSKTAMRHLQGPGSRVSDIKCRVKAEAIQCPRKDRDRLHMTPWCQSQISPGETVIKSHNVCDGKVGVNLDDTLSPGEKAVFANRSSSRDKDVGLMHRTSSGEARELPEARDSIVSRKTSLIQTENMPTTFQALEATKQSFSSENGQRFDIHEEAKLENNEKHEDVSSNRYCPSRESSPTIHCYTKVEQITPGGNFPEQGGLRREELNDCQVIDLTEEGAD